jgi:polyhydroxyalkanoate synthesis regulator phasin
VHHPEYKEETLRDEVRRMALFGSGVAELTRHRAEQLARDLVERSKQNRDEVLKLIRGEIQNQIASLGVPSKRDIERLERRVARLETQVKELQHKKAPAKATTRKSPSKKKSSSASPKDR